MRPTRTVPRACAGRYVGPFVRTVIERTTRPIDFGERWAGHR